MKVAVHHLKEGCIVSKDLYSQTPKPVLPKDTVLTNVHLDVLQAFLFESVEIYPVMANGGYFFVDEAETAAQKSSYVSAYLKGIETFKKEFTRWENGMQPDLFILRKLFLSLLDRYLHNKNELFSLHRNSSPKTYPYHHSLTVGLLSSFLAKKLHYADNEIKMVGLAGILADFGMTKLPAKFTTGTVSLTDKEYKDLKNHPIVSAQVIKNLPTINQEMILGVLQHHEREDGSGYPYGFHGNKIHHYAKIIAVADAFHAMISERTYRKQQSPFKVLDNMKTDQFGRFDQRILDVLTNEVANLSVGTKVRLTNRDIGEIVFIQPQSPTRPIVKLDDGTYLTLNNHRELYIDEILL